MVVNNEIDHVFESGGDGSTGDHGVGGNDGRVFVEAVDEGDHVFGELVGDAEGVFVAGFGECSPESFYGSSEL